VLRSRLRRRVARAAIAFQRDVTSESAGSAWRRSRGPLAVAVPPIVCAAYASRRRARVVGLARLHGGCRGLGRRAHRRAFDHREDRRRRSLGAPVGPCAMTSQLAAASSLAGRASPAYATVPTAGPASYMIAGDAVAVIAVGPALHIPPPDRARDRSRRGLGRRARAADSPAIRADGGRCSRRRCLPWPAASAPTRPRGERRPLRLDTCAAASTRARSWRSLVLAGAHTGNLRIDRAAHDHQRWRSWWR
jgi:hypothetical protein